jgi:hypothetical protein
LGFFTGTAGADGCVDPLLVIASSVAQALSMSKDKDKTRTLGNCGYIIDDPSLSKNNAGTVAQTAAIWKHLYHLP